MNGMRKAKGRGEGKRREKGIKKNKKKGRRNRDGTLHWIYIQENEGRDQKGCGIKHQKENNHEKEV